MPPPPPVKKRNLTTQKNRKMAPPIFLDPLSKLYWSYSPHRSRDSVYAGFFIFVSRFPYTHIKTYFTCMLLTPNLTFTSSKGRVPKQNQHAHTRGGGPQASAHTTCLVLGSPKTSFLFTSNSIFHIFFDLITFNL